MSDQKTQLQGIGRVVSSVVDIQQTMLHKFEALTKSLEDLKLEHNKGIAQLRDEIRRSDDRSAKNYSEMYQLHNKEMERLHQIILAMITRDSTATTFNQQLPMHQLSQQFAMQQQAVVQQQVAAQQQAALSAALQRQMEAMVNQKAPQQAFTAQLQQQLAAVAASQQAPRPQAPAPAPAPVIQPAQPVVAIPAAKPAPTAEVSILSNTPPSNPPTLTPVEKPKPATTTPATSGFTFGGPSIFGKKPETSSTVVIPPVAPAAAANDDEEDQAEEYEPEGEFAPVIPLPDLVEVTTGEEEEQVMFNNRAKLYIYSSETSEWKERGTGELKMLYNKEAKKWRVVMRRDQVTISEDTLRSENGKEEELCYRFEVLKVCANFPIVGSMSIQKMTTNEKAYTWFCEDFSEDEPAHVKLSARFANVDIAIEFKTLFEKAVAEHKGGKTIDSEIKPAAEVKKEIKKEVKEEAKKEVTVPSNNKENGFGDKFKPKPGSWECKACYISNKAADEQCVACQTNKDGSAGEKNIFSKPSILQPTPGTPKVTFGFGASAQAKESPAPTGSQFGASLNGSPATTSSIFGGGGTPKSSIFGGAATPSFSFTKPATAATPSFNFKTASPATAPQGNSLFGGSKTESPAPAASFSYNKPETSSGTPKFSFGMPPAVGSSTPSTTAASADDKKTETPKNIFGSFAKGGESFASFAAKSGNTSIFSPDNTQKAQQELASQKKTSIFGSKTAAPSQPANDDEGAENEDGDYEPEVDFVPVVPLPDLVEVKTGEEDEEVVFTARCKLYKYYADLQENKERGVGDLKILKNTDNKYRIVMRREQVHKLCANFRIEKAMKLTPKPNLPQVLTFMCQDFSEDLANADTAIFTAKFKDESIANDFKKAVLDAQATM